MLIDKLLTNEGIFVNPSWTDEQKEFYFAKSHWMDGGDPIKNLKAKLKEAVCFDIDNIFDIYSYKLINEGVAVSDFPNIKMPFSVMWFENKCFGKEYQDGNYRVTGFYNKRVGTLLFENDYRDGLYSILAFGFILPENEESIAIGGWWEIQYDEQGKLVPHIQYPMMPGEVLENKEAFWGNSLTWFLLMPLASISFMHCKNVVIQSIEPPIALQKARIRKHKLPFVAYKTLEIKPMVKILREEGESETKGMKNALHICRGHFKDFTKGKGLFGRNKGLYWWESQVRGDAETGIIAKDYKVTPKK